MMLLGLVTYCVAAMLKPSKQRHVSGQDQLEPAVLVGLKMIG